MMNKLGSRLEKIGKVVANAGHSTTSAATIDMAKTRPYEEMPGPKVYPYIGAAMSLKPFGGDLDFMEYDKFLFKLNEKYGDLVRLDLFNQKQIFTYKPEHARIIFQNEDPNPLRPSLTPWVLYAQRKKYSLSLVNSQGEEWRKQRSASNPIVAKPKTVANYLGIHNAMTDEFFANVNKKIAESSDKSVVEEKFENQLKLLALEMMSIVAFDHRINCLSEKKMSDDVMKLFVKIAEYSELTVNLFWGVPLWKYYRTPKWNRFEATSDYIYEFSRKYVLEAYEKMKTKPIEQVGGTMLEQFYLNMEKSKLTLGDIVSMMSEFLLASFDTTITTLHFLLTEIGQHPEIQEEIYREIEAAYPKDGVLDTDFFSKIPLLKASLKESQRTNSIAPATTRILSNDIILDNYLIPKGTYLNVGLVAIGHSEKYFKNPKEFNPKRWLKTERSGEAIDPYASLPFGFGARMCIGRRLAEQKIYLIMSKLLKNYKVEYLGGDEPPKFRLIKIPGNDLKLKLTPRQQN